MTTKAASESNDLLAFVTDANSHSPLLALNSYFAPMLHLTKSLPVSASEAVFTEHWEQVPSGFRSPSGSSLLTEYFKRRPHGSPRRRHPEALLSLKGAHCQGSAVKQNLLQGREANVDISRNKRNPKTSGPVKQKNQQQLHFFPLNI